MFLEFINKKQIAFSILSLILIDNIFNAFFLQFYPNGTWVLASKEMLLGLFFLVFIFNWKTIFFKIPFWFYLIFGLLIASFFISNANEVAKIASLRQILIPYIIFIAGMYLNELSLDETRFYLWLKRAAIFLIIASVLMYCNFIFSGIIFENYFATKQAITTVFGIPFMFYDPMTGDFLRNVSSFLDPINLGHALLFLFFVLKLNHKIDYFLKALLLLFMTITICKGAYLQMILVFAFLLRNKIPIWAQILLVIFGISMVVFLSNYHEGIKLHLDGFLVSLKTITFFGHGLGTVGNQSLLFGALNTIPIYDTFIGSIIGQIGIVGFIIWLLPMFFISYKIFESNKIAVYLLFSQLIVSILSENAFNFLSIYFLMLLLGILFSKKLLNEK